MFGYIYKTTNLINNKIYIGKKEKNKFDKNYYGSGKLIKRAIKKYGIENFYVEVIYWCDSLEELNSKEKYFIKKYNSLYSSGGGYNIAIGGDGGNLIVGMSDAQLKIYKINKSIQNSGSRNPNYNNGEKIKGDKNPSKRLDVRKKISNKLKGKNNPMYGRFGEKHPNYNKKLTDETKNKIKESLKYKIYKKQCKNCSIFFDSTSARKSYCNGSCKRQYRDNLKTKDL